LKCFTKTQTFNPDWPEPELIEPNRDQTERKHDFSIAGSSITQFLCVTTTNKLVSILNLEV